MAGDGRIATLPFGPAPENASASGSSKWREDLRQHFGQSIFQDWLQHLQLKSCDEGIWVFGTPSPFVKDWIQTHYADMMAMVLGRQETGCQKIVFVEGFSPEHRSLLDLEQAEGHEPVEDDPTEIASSTLDPRLTFENFVVGKPNEFAYAAAKKVSESDDASYNPLFLYGPVGHGKTHLMHSIAHAIHARTGGGRKILYLTAEKFMYYFIRALRYKNIMSFKERFRSVHVLMIDDVQFISGKDSTQEEFFHTFNALVDDKRLVVVSADKSPSDLEGIQERMRSRLGWGLAADLHPTTYELRIGILQSKASHQRLHIPHNVFEFLAAHISSSVRELEGALNKVVAHASLMDSPITLEMAQASLKNMLRSQHVVALEDIERKICDYFGIKLVDLHSAKRARSISRPRQIAMFLAKQLTPASLPAIGKYFGGRDHSTVIHAVATIEELSKTDKSVREDISLLRHSLEKR